LSIAALALVAYLLGSIPFGLWLVKAWKGIDVREVGSGNIGTTNVYRAAGKGAAIAVFLLDVAKGVLPVYLALWLGMTDWAAVLMGVMAILGHSKSIFLGFTGGKSVATGIGTILALSPVGAVLTLGVFAVVFAASRLVSLGSILASLALPAILYALQAPPVYLYYAAGAAAYVVVRHRANIQRLVAGKENRL
jgi:glycerol-3-phosphate acyltransferase PlsY